MRSSLGGGQDAPVWVGGHRRAVLEGRRPGVKGTFQGTGARALQPSGELAVGGAPEGGG